jgi:hypothetical protein
MIQAGDQSTASRTALTLTLDIEPESDSALLRVLSTLHRRRCRVTRATFRADTGHFDQLDLCVEVATFYAPQVRPWLEALVDVHRATAHGSLPRREVFDT